MSHPFQPTPHPWWRLSQRVVFGSAAMSSVALRRVAHPATRSHALLTGILVFAIACLTRFILQETQSRLQILAFAAAAALAERLRSRMRGTRFSIGRWAAHAGAAACGILLAKHVLEPGSITDFVLRLFDRAGIAAPSWLVSEG